MAAHFDVDVVGVSVAGGVLYRLADDPDQRLGVFLLDLRGRINLDGQASAAAGCDVLGGAG